MRVPGVLQGRLLLPPDVKGRLADTHLPADIAHRRARFRSPQRVRNLFLGELALLHRSCSWAAPRPGLKRPYSSFDLVRNSGPTLASITHERSRLAIGHR